MKELEKAEAKAHKVRPCPRRAELRELLTCIDVLQAVEKAQNDLQKANKKLEKHGGDSGKQDELTKAKEAVQVSSRGLRPSD